MIFLGALGWHVRGLHNPARRQAVRELATAAKASILCLQETKVSSFDPPLARETADAIYSSWFSLPADGTRGGIAIFWNPDVVCMTNLTLHHFLISATVTLLQSGLAGLAFVLSMVYGPAEDALKPEFLQEMKDLTPPPPRP
ncbi:hypothetical protein BRADI_4g42037v3, partial [Brachypodium distachyon]